MKVAHFYPGLQYRASKIPWRVLKYPHAKDAIDQASRLLDKDVVGICQKEGNFSSMRERVVISLAVNLAVGRYYLSLKKHTPADLIIGSSFGNYTGLVIANSIEYQNTLSAVAIKGELIDVLHSGYQTFLLKAIPREAVQAFTSTCADITLIGHSKSEGAAVTLPAENFPSLLHFVKYSGGKVSRIPLRLKFHVPLPRQLTHAFKGVINNLHIVPPLTPFFSTHTATMVRSPRKIREILVHFPGKPDKLAATAGEIVNKEIKIVYIETSGIREGK